MVNRETDFYTLTSEKLASDEATITFKHPSGSAPFPRYKHDWYIIVALEKADKVIVDRHLLTRELILNYRWAIREGYQHQFDPALRREYDYPRNRNTIAGIQSYIERIKKASEQNESY